jgi:hypothetical protein
MLPNRTARVTFPRKYASLLTRSTRPRNCCNAFSAVARVIRLAAVAEERVRPAWVTSHAPRPAASISPSDRRALTRARPFPGVNPAAASNSASPHCSRERRCRSVERTSSAGYCPIVPFASMRISFQHRPMRPALATAGPRCLPLSEANGLCSRGEYRLNSASAIPAFWHCGATAVSNAAAAAAS